MTYRLPDPLIALLERRAVELGRSPAEVLRRILEAEARREAKQARRVAK